VILKRGGKKKKKKGGGNQDPGGKLGFRGAAKEADGGALRLVWSAKKRVMYVEKD